MRKHITDTKCIITVDLGNTQYILWSTNPDSGFLSMLGEKNKNKNSEVRIFFLPDIFFIFFSFSLLVKNDTNKIKFCRQNF